MGSAFALILFGLLHANAVDTAAAPEPRALVVVVLPTSAHGAIVEALHRLRGEATAVGFDVRFVEGKGGLAQRDRLESVARELRPAAVVAFAPAADGEDARSLDMWFWDRTSGTTSVAHLNADPVDGEPDGDDGRADVVLAVRAVDFIRARMFDALVGRRSEPEATPAVMKRPRDRRIHAALGVDVLGSRGRFSPAWVPHIELGYRWSHWSRVAVSAFGLGSRPQAANRDGTASLDFRGVTLGLSWLGPVRWRLRPVLEAGVGQYWVLVRGQPAAGTTGTGLTTTKPSAGASATLHMAFEIAPFWYLELHGGALWLVSPVRVDMTDIETSDSRLGSIGTPLWMGGLRLSALF